MLVLNCKQPTYFDVDDTLVMWGYYNEAREGTVEIRCDGVSQWLVPHKRHIDQLKAHKARGNTIIVWSQGGSMWAEAVVKSLNLVDFVDLCIEKPHWLYDDLQCCGFMPKSKYLKDNIDV